MKLKWQYTTTRLAVILWVAWSLFNPAAAHSSCAAGASVPPFLAAGLDPNLLLMIDNSASMYDLAYVQPREEGYCYDGTYTASDNNLVESYTAVNEYAGYFDPATWYSYNIASGQFEDKTTAQALTVCVSASYAHANTLCIAINESVSPKTVDSFVARGNFLNWATGSKLGIQKNILTGGKYDTAAGRPGKLRIKQRPRR